MNTQHFSRVPPSAGDPIVSLNEDIGGDVRASKVNLGIGVYRDEHGALRIDANFLEAPQPASNAQVSDPTWESTMNFSAEAVRRMWTRPMPRRSNGSCESAWNGR